MNGDRKLSDIRDGRIPILTYYSPSHEPLFKRFFLPSYEVHLRDSFNLIVQRGDQRCNGDFRKGKWNSQVREKIDFVNDFIQNTTLEFFVFSDVDVVFLQDIRKDLFAELGSYDMAFQNDGGALCSDHNLCSGFYFVRVNCETKDFFKRLISKYDDVLSDQQNLNHMLLYSPNVLYKAMSKRFYNLSGLAPNIWTPATKIFPPDHRIVMYHANFTLGLENKATLLEYFQTWNNTLHAS